MFPTAFLAFVAGVCFVALFLIGRHERRARKAVAATRRSRRGPPKLRAGDRP